MGHAQKAHNAAADVLVLIDSPLPRPEESHCHHVQPAAPKALLRGYAGTCHGRARYALRWALALNAATTRRREALLSHAEREGRGERAWHAGRGHSLTPCTMPARALARARWRPGYLQARREGVSEMASGMPSVLRMPVRSSGSRAMRDAAARTGGSGRLSATLQGGSYRVPNSSSRLPNVRVGDRVG